MPLGYKLKTVEWTHEQAVPKWPWFSYTVLLAEQHTLIWDAPSIITNSPWIIYLLHLPAVCSLSAFEERQACEEGWTAQYTRLADRSPWLQMQCNS